MTSPEVSELLKRIEKLETALRIFTGAAYPVDQSINPRGHNWSEAYLDQALPIARKALRARSEIMTVRGERNE